MATRLRRTFVVALLITCYRVRTHVRYTENNLKIIRKLNPY